MANAPHKVAPGAPGSPSVGTSASGRGGRGPGLALQGALILLLCLGAVVAAVFVVAGSQGVRAAERTVTQDLGSTQAVQTAFQQQRYQRLNLISRLFATDQLLNTYMVEAAEEQDQAALEASIEEYQNLLTFDLGVVLDRNATVMARTDGARDQANLSQTPLMAVALQEQKASGVWFEGGQLYHAVAVPLVREYELVGYTVAAYAINNALASQIERSGGAKTVFLASTPTGPQAVATTLGDAETAELVPALRLAGGAFERVLEKGEAVTEIHVELGAQPMVVSLAPLRDAAGEPVGAVAAITDRDSARTGYRMVVVATALTALVAALLGGVLLVWRTKSAAGPVAAVADAVAQAAAGRWDTPLPDTGGDLGRLVESLRAHLGRLREKRSLETVVGRAARLVSDAPAPADETDAVAVDGAVLAIELRRYADPKLGYDPAANVARLGRDVERIGASVASQGGRVASVAGHRVLAVFSGDDHARRALVAANEIALTMGQRESAFDEAQPPAIALNVGNLVLGGVHVDDHRADAVAGLPVVLLDALLREAHPGPIYFSKPVWAVLGQALHQAQVAVQAQKAVLCTQPIYLAQAEELAKLTGARPRAESGGPVGHTRTLADVAAGMDLGSRFRVQSHLGDGPLGRVFKAADNEMGDVVTLKLLRPELLRDATRFERIKQVVARARSVRHPNVLAMFDFGETERMPFLSIEYASGLTLAQVLDRAGRLPLASTLRIARQTAWGLAAAHGHQVMHGALKPSNILLEGDGTVRVMDFGLARAAGTANAPTATLDYLAPEQLAGQDHDSRADFWSFAAIIYRVLSGEPLLRGTTQAELLAASQAPLPDLATKAPDTPSALVAIVRRCLARNPDERYPTVDVLLRELEAIQL